MRHPRQLEQQVIIALQQSLAEKQTEAAEHLLCAIEALCSVVSPETALTDGCSTTFGMLLEQSTPRIVRQ